MVKWSASARRPFTSGSQKERIEAQNTPFDAKMAFLVTEPEEMYLKGILVSREGGKATVKTLCGKVSTIRKCIDLLQNNFR